MVVTRKGTDTARMEQELALPAQKTVRSKKQQTPQTSNTAAAPTMITRVGSLIAASGATCFAAYHALNQIPCFQSSFNSFSEHFSAWVKWKTLNSVLDAAILPEAESQSFAMKYVNTITKLEEMGDAKSAEGYFYITAGIALTALVTSFVYQKCKTMHR